MAWNDAPPDADLKKSSGAGWDSAPPDPDLQAPWHGEHSLSGFGDNLMSDVKGTASGMMQMVQGLVEHPVDTLVNTAKGLPSGIINEGKRLGVGELLTGHPINAVQKLGQAAYDKPLTTGLEAAPVVGAAGKALGIGSGEATAADLGAQTAKEGVAADTAGQAAKTAPEAVAGDLPKPPPVVPPVSADPIQEVKDYVGGKYSKFASKPGMVPKIADYMQDKSQKMALQQAGASPMQIKSLSEDPMLGNAKARALGQYLMDKDIVGPSVTHSQMLERHAQLLKEAGQTIGNLREEADSLRNPVKNNVDVLQAVREKLDPVYLRGGTSGTGKKAYLLALQDIEKSEPTFQGAADAATELNRNANKAAKINQPHSPYTDVANTMSHINNERIKQLLGPAKAAIYDEALKDFGANKAISQFLRRKVGGEVKRIGAGSFTSNMIQKGMDEFGYRAGSKALNKTSNWVLKNPSSAKSLPSMFKEFIHNIDLPDETNQPGMAHGGIVPELNDFLTSKYGQKEKQTR